MNVKIIIGPHFKEVQKEALKVAAEFLKSTLQPSADSEKKVG